MSSSHLEMSATNEDTVNRGTDQAATDAGTASRQDAVVNEEMPQDLSDTVTVAESVNVVADVVANVSSETSNSSQGLVHFYHCLFVIVFQVLFCSASIVFSAVSIHVFVGVSAQSTLRRAVLTVFWIVFCHTGSISLCVDSFVFMCLYFVFWYCACVILL